jgi:hypothetical protein
MCGLAMPALLRTRATRVSGAVVLRSAAPRAALVARWAVLRLRQHGHIAQAPAVVFLGEIGPWICALGYVRARFDLTQFLGQAPGFAQCALNGGGAAGTGSPADGSPQGHEAGAGGSKSQPGSLLLIAGCSGEGGEAVETQPPDAPGVT